MNINNVEETKDIPEDIWKAIFAKQWELALKYKDIENMGDLLETLDNNINTAKGQKWIKDFSWRVVEELAEAAEVEFKLNEMKFNNSKFEVEAFTEYNNHYKEEIIDALHFLVELTIISGYDEELVKSLKGDGNISMLNTIIHLGLMCNTLKNKPWKQTQMLTDRVKFEDELKTAWCNFLKLLKYAIGDDTEIYQYYFKKHAVNQFRQRTKY